MKIEIVNKKNAQTNDKLKEVIEKKVGKLDKYFDAETPIKVTLKSEGDKCKFDLQMKLQDCFLGAEAIADNPYDAIDMVLPKIEKQIIKYRKRFDKKIKSNAFDNAYLFAAAYENTPDKIVKKKQFDLSPMSIEEAMFQMDALGHEFYVFLNEQTGKVAVLYKRFENDYGLIEPKY